MPSFSCATCGTSFSLPDEVLARYPGWTPRTCRNCKAKNGSSSGSSSSRSSASRSSASRSSASRATAPRSASVEENLPVDEVLAKYHGGPKTGVFTDGACQPNPGPGGWGAVWVKDDLVVEQRYGKDPDTTNNRMELTAILAALEMLPVDEDVTLYSDSKLCIQTLDEWAQGWERAGWKRKTGPIANLELVQKAYALRTARPRVKLQHIRAHSGERWNEYADSLATAWTRDRL